MKKTLFFSILAMLITFAAKAQTQTYSYIDEDGTPATTSSATEIDDDSPITSPLADGWYYVSSETDFTGDLEISGDVKLILYASLTIDGSIQILADASLTIYGTTEDLIDQATLSANDINGVGTLTVNGYLNVSAATIGFATGTVSILGGRVTDLNGSDELTIVANKLTLGYKSMSDKIKCSGISANDITIAEGCSYKLAGNTYSGTLTSSDITNFCTGVATNRGLEKTSVTFDDGNFSYTIWDDGTVAVSGFASGATAPKNLTIPSSVEYNGTSYAVTIIGNNAFQYNNDIHTVIIPSSVVEIGVWAFGNGTLETVEVQGSSLKKIGEYAFYYTQLKEITLPSSIQSIGAGAFDISYNPEGFTVICLDNTPPEVGENTFHVGGYPAYYLYIPPCADYSNTVWSDYFGSNIYGYVPFDQTGLDGTYGKEFDGSVDVQNFTPVTLTPADGVTLTFTKLEFADPNVEVDYNGNPVAKPIIASYNLTYSANEGCNTTGNKIRLKEVSATITPHEITQDEIESVIKSRRTPITDDYYAYAKAGHYEGSNNGKLDGRYTTTVVLYPNDPAKTAKFRLNAYYVDDESSTTIVASANDAKYIHIETNTDGFWNNTDYETYNYAFPAAYNNFEGAIGNFQPYVERSADETTLTFKYDILPTDANITYYTFPDADNKVPDWDETGNKTNITKVVFDPFFKDAAPTSCLYWFNGFEGLTTIQDIQYLNTADVTRMDGMFASCKALQAVDVSHFDTKRVVYMNDMFASCELLETIDVSHFNTENVTNMESMFSDCKKVKLLDVSGFDTRKVTTMYRMFNECSILETLDVSHFNTYNVTTMSSMFYNCPNLNPLDVSGFDTHNVKDMTFMFNNCNQSNLDVSHFDTKKVTKMSYMFCAYKGTTLDLSSFNTELVEDMSYMFANSKNLTSLDVSSFNTSNVTNMRAMFGYTYADNQLVTEGNNLTSINFGDNFNTQKVTDMAYMFFGCKKLESLDLGNQLYTSAVIDMSYMFDQCSSLTSLDLSKFNTEKVTNMQRMFYNCTSLKKIYVTEGQWTNEKAMSSSKTFSGDTQLIGDKGTKYDASHTTSEYARIDDPANGTPGYLTAAKEAYVVFDYSTNTLIFKCGDRASEGSINVYDLPTDNTTDPGWLGMWATSINKVVFDPSFDFARPVTCYKWFSGCEKLTEITGMEYLHTDKVTDMSYMFNHCEALQMVDLSKFNTSNVTNMESMFAGCIKMRMLDLTSFNTENVTNMKWMFNLYATQAMYSTSLEVIYVGDGWNTRNVTSHDDMFYYNDKLEGGNGTKFDGSKALDKTYAKIDGGNTDPGYLTGVANYGYAVLNGNTLTFKQGSKPAVVDGELFELTQSKMTFEYNGNNRTDVRPAWYNKRADIQYVVFEDGFQNVIVRNCNYWFDGCTNLASITNLTKLNTSQVTEMRYMFSDCEKLDAIDLSGFNTGNAYDFRDMFQGCKGLTSLDVSHITFNLTKYPNNDNTYWIKVDAMFANSGLTSINLSSWASTPLSSYAALFQNCENLVSVDVTDIVTSETKSIDYMFFGCSKLGTDTEHPLDVSSFNTENVTDMSYLFDGCTGLQSIDVSKFNTAKVKDMSYMFDDCSSLSVLDISNFNTENVTNMDFMFADCHKLTTIKVGSNWNTGKATSSKNMFQGDYNLIGNYGAMVDVSKYNGSSYTNDVDKANCTKQDGYLTTGNYKIFYDLVSDDGVSDLATASELASAFATNSPAVTEFAHGAAKSINNPKDLTGNPFNGWTGAGITKPTKNLTIAADDPGNRIYTANWTVNREAYAVYDDTDGKNTLTFYFDANKPDAGSFALNTADNAPDWGSKSAVVLKVVFDDSFQEYKGVTSCYQWFKGFSKLTALDLRNLKTSNVTNMTSMFNGCSNLTGILIGDNWSTDKVTASANMFTDCTSLIGEGGEFASQYVDKDKTYAYAEDEYGNGYLTKDNFKIFYTLNDIEENGGDGNAQFSDGSDDNSIIVPCSDDEATTLETPTWTNHIFSGWSKATAYIYNSESDSYDYVYDTEEPLHQKSVSPGSGNWALMGLWDKNHTITLPEGDWELTDEFERALPKDSNGKPTAPQGATIIIKYKGTKVVKEVQVETTN